MIKMLKGQKKYIEKVHDIKGKNDCSVAFGYQNKVNRKVQGMPQSQTAAKSRHQEEEKKDKNIHAPNKQTNVRKAQRPTPSSPSEVIRMLKQTEKRGHRAGEDFKTLSYTELRTTPGPSRTVYLLTQ